MRASRLVLVATAAVVANLAASQPARNSNFIITFADTVAGLNKELGDGVTVSAWRRSHPGATFADKVAPCAEGLLTINTPDGQITVAADFHEPAAPPSLDLPPASSALVDQCVFQYFLVRRLNSVAQDNAPAAMAVSRLLSARLGVTSAPAQWMGRPPAAFWQSGETRTALVTSDRDISVSGVAGDLIDLQIGRASLAALESAQRVRNRLRLERFDEALRLGAVDSDAVSTMRTELAAWIERTADPDKDSPERVIGAMRALVVDARPAAAARYLAAELLMDFAKGEFGVADPNIYPAADKAFRRSLGQMGTDFVYAELGRRYMYDHSWLKAAVRERPSGRIEELVFLTRVEMGFETSFACRDQKGEGFRTVITLAQRFLAAHPDTAIRGRLQLNLAKAFGDVVAARDVGYGAAPTTTREARIASDRATRAFLEAVRIDGATPDAAEIWQDMWRIRAGLAPAATHFACYYD